MLKTLNILRRIQRPNFLNATNNYVRAKNSSNPGIQKRLRLPIYEAQNIIEEFDLEDPELDIETAKITPEQHKRSIEKEREQLALNIVKRKHFKETNPNFLTWTEKEQIRKLHRGDPDEWPIERLVESFPALHETIAKLVKNKWQPKSEMKIKNHDDNVKKNWEMFRRKKLDLNPILSEHLSKFSQRKALFIQDNIVKSEFSDLMKIVNKTDSNNVQMIENALPSIKFENNKSITFEQFKSTSHIPERKINYPTTPIDQTDLNLHTEIILHKDPQDQGQQVVQVRDFIKIPRKVWKKGATYRIEDSYYDDDGEFLYRVLGMTKTK